MEHAELEIWEQGLTPMWFLIKSTVFLMMTLVVLSFFSTDDSGSARLSASNMTDAVISAGEIVHYMTGICVEKPEVCVKGAQTMALLGERTREGAKVAYHLFEGQFGDDAELAKAPSPAQDAVTDKISTGTINAAATTAAAQPNAEAALATMRIPVPMRRPQR
jgi:hypothetical protein